jgi:hypothetical protein
LYWCFTCLNGKNITSFHFVIVILQEKGQGYFVPQNEHHHPALQVLRNYESYAHIKHDSLVVLESHEVLEIIIDAQAVAPPVAELKTSISYYNSSLALEADKIQSEMVRVEFQPPVFCVFFF